MIFGSTNAILIGISESILSERVILLSGFAMPSYLFGFVLRHTLAVGGNSAGQVAMFLSEQAEKLLLVIRGAALAKSMSSTPHQKDQVISLFRTAFVSGPPSEPNIGLKIESGRPTGEVIDSD